MIQKSCEESSTKPEMIEFILPLAELTKQWDELTMEVGRKASSNAEEIGAAAVDYLSYSGYVALAYWWARSVAAAEAGNHDAAFKQGKRDTVRFYFARILPRVNVHAAGVRSVVQSLPAI